MKRILLALILGIIPTLSKADFILTPLHCTLYEDYLGALYKMKISGLPKSDALRDIARWATDPTGTPQRMEVYPLMMTAFDFVYGGLDELSQEERFKIQVDHCKQHIGVTLK